MDDYEILIERISQEIPVIEGAVESGTGFTALYRNGRIYLEKNITNRKKKVVLAEEYGHYKRTVGNILDYKASGAWKEEWKARRYGIEMLITLDDLLSCALNGCNNKYEYSEYLNVTAEFLEDALLHYYNKYGTKHYHRNYIFTFDSESIFVEPMKIFC
ncbi:ImmA/IrrE family metallo-endopeptidase [Enterococcus sp.]|uniref:ImmA/IrrE family metallo-endopeptidase n=1 Tax=Enterococcus sp. TaxID=35783 RepID=UPI003991699F